MRGEKRKERILESESGGRTHTAVRSLKIKRIMSRLVNKQGSKQTGNRERKSNSAR
jgi:hypothetical protein